MYFPCEVEFEIPRSSHGQGVVALQSKAPSPCPREEGIATSSRGPRENLLQLKPRTLVTCVSVNIRQLGNLFPARCLP